MNAQKNNLAPLSDRERAVLIGCLLGDGTLQKRGTSSFRYRVSQSIKQEEYVNWKYQQLKRLCATTQPPRKVEDNKGLVTVEFYTSSGPYLQKLYELFYRETLVQNKMNRNGPGQEATDYDYVPTKFIKKITPELIENLPLDPVFLAVWFMDDGSVRNDCYAGNIATQCFSLEEHHLLQNYFRKTWGIECNISRHSQKSGQYYLYLPSKSFTKFVQLIESTVREIPSMVYKLNEDRRAR